MEKPAFEVANDNVSLDFFPETTIPAAKTAARAELALAMSAPGIKITVCPPVNRPVQEPWKPSQKKAANDNRELVSWPLLEKLKRDGHHADAELVEHYRGLIALMAVEPLQGQDPTRHGDGLEIETRSSIDDEDVDEAAAKGWPSDKVPGGNIVYKETRQLVKSPGTASRARSATDKTVVHMKDMGLRFNERTLLAQIDMRHVLPRLRLALGPLVAPFEDAVLGGATFGQIGEARHYRGKQAEAAGKVLVMTALDAVREEWATIRKEVELAEKQAERNVERRRAQIAARQAEYLRRAA